MTKKIPLTQGRYALVDDKDEKRLSRFRWQASPEGPVRHEVVPGEGGERQTVRRVEMAREIVSVPGGDDLDIDFENGDVFDLRRENVRLSGPHFGETDEGEPERVPKAMSLRSRDSRDSRGSGANVLRDALLRESVLLLLSGEPLKSVAAGSGLSVKAVREARDRALSVPEGALEEAKKELEFRKAALEIVRALEGRRIPRVSLPDGDRDVIVRPRRGGTLTPAMRRVLASDVLRGDGAEEIRERRGLSEDLITEGFVEGIRGDVFSDPAGALDEARKEYDFRFEVLDALTTGDSPEKRGAAPKGTRAPAPSGEEALTVSETIRRGKEASTSVSAKRAEKIGGAAGCEVRYARKKIDTWTDGGEPLGKSGYYLGDCEGPLLRIGGRKEEAERVLEGASLLEIVEEYEALRDRKINPEGHFDKRGLWFPRNRLDCCEAVKVPTAKFPYSLMIHCRSADHVATVRGVKSSVLRGASRRWDINRKEFPLLPLERPAERVAAFVAVSGKHKKAVRNALSLATQRHPVETILAAGVRGEEPKVPRPRTKTAKTAKTAVCDNCGKEYERTWNHEAKRTYCSIPCRSEGWRRHVQPEASVAGTLAMEELNLRGENPAHSPAAQKIRGEKASAANRGRRRRKDPTQKRPRRKDRTGIPNAAPSEHRAIVRDLLSGMLASHAAKKYSRSPATVGRIRDSAFGDPEAALKDAKAEYEFRSDIRDLVRLRERGIVPEGATPKAKVSRVSSVTKRQTNRHDLSKAQRREIGLEILSGSRPAEVQLRFGISEGTEVRIRQSIFTDPERALEEARVEYEFRAEVADTLRESATA